MFLNVRKVIDNKKSSWSRYDDILYLKSEVLKFVNSISNDACVVIEKPYYNRKNPKVFSEQMILFGLVLFSIIEKENQIWFDPEPKTIKKFFTENGNASKEDMYNAMISNKNFQHRIFCDIETCIKKSKLKKDKNSLILKREGLIDAYAMALFGYQQIKNQEK